MERKIEVVEIVEVNGKYEEKSPLKMQTLDKVTNLACRLGNTCLSMECELVSLNRGIPGTQNCIRRRLGPLKQGGWPLPVLEKESGNNSGDAFATSSLDHYEVEKASNPQ